MSRAGRRFAALRSAAAGLPPARGLLPLLALLAAWQLLQRGPSPYFPAPAEWWTSTAPLWSNGQLLPALAATVETFAEGLLLAGAIGAVLGVAIGISAAASRALGPLLEFLRAVPPPATVPVAALLIGYGETMKLLVVVLAALWPILLNTSAAAARIAPLLLDVAESFRLTPAARLRKIVLPSIVPALLLGIRVALPVAIVVTLLVEMLTSLPGVGALMIQATRNFQSAQVYGLLVLVGLLGFVVNDVFAVVEGAILRRWPPRSGAAR